MNVTSTSNDTTSDVMITVNTTIDVISTLNVTNGIITPLTLIVTPVLNTTESEGLVTTFNATDVIFTLNGTFTSTFDPNSTDATSSPETSTSDVKVLEQRIASTIDFWVPPFLFFIGTLANVFVVMVMQSKHFRRMSTSFYMAVSSMVDIISLVVSLPAHYLYVNFPQIFDSVRNAHVMCSFFNLFGWGSSDMGVLLTVAMTTERCLAIQFPLKAPTLCTVKRAKIVTVCLFFFEILKVGHLVFTSRVAPKEVTAYLCDVDRQFSEDYKIFYDHYWPYIHNIFLMVAFIIIIIGNIIITIHVKRSEDSKDMGEGAKNTGGSQQGKTTSKTRQLSLMLIIDSVTIILCTLPFAIYVVLAQAFQLFDDTPQGRGKQSMVFAICFYLLYVNRCANFFLYCISGARFRQALKEILSRKPPKKSIYATGATNTRHATSSSVATEGSGDNRVCMSPMGPGTSGAARNGDAQRTSTSFSGPSTISGSVVNGRSKLERHYGKTLDGK